jgi:aminoglycoside phosphotransferase (APT) family kinase protein
MTWLGSAAVDLDVLAGQLQLWARDHYDDPVTVAGVEAMPGHAGLSFGFRVERNGTLLDDLVMRMPPKGVRRQGNTDVLRQVPLLQALRRHGSPVAEVRWWSDDEQWFEVPFFMVGRLPGTIYAVRDPDPSFGPDAAATVFDQAVAALAHVHALDWRVELADWEAARPLVDEIRYWDPILAKAAEPAWVAAGERARDLLLAHIPADPPVGLFHGDFQTNNILFDSGRLVAVIDWEISGIGAPLLDLGWLLMMNDAASWVDGPRPGQVPEFGDLVDRYASASGRPLGLDDLAFYRALSGYRFGAIAGLNVMLHRSGKRPDPEWERIALSVSLLFGRAADLLEGAD